MPLSMDTRPAAYAIIIERGYILLSHLSPGAAPNASGWTLPGGGMDPGEQPEDTVIREVFEETGFRIGIDALMGVHTAYFEPAKAGERTFCALRTVYRAHTVGGGLQHELDGSTNEARWIPLTDLDKISHVQLVDVAAQMMGYDSAAAWAASVRAEMKKQASHAR